MRGEADGRSDDVVGAGGRWSIGVHEGRRGQLSCGRVGEELVEVVVVSWTGVAFVFDVADEAALAVEPKAEIRVNSDLLSAVEVE